MTNLGDATRFTTVDRTPDTSFFIEFLDAGNALESVVALKPRLTALLGDLSGKSVLDLGCGTGDDARQLALLTGSAGHVLGIDVSEAMIAEARRRAAGSGRPVEFRVGDAQHLDMPDASVDACRTERMLMHVPDAGAALREMVRVTRPGGRIVIFDFDLDTMVVDHPDAAMTRQVVLSFSDGIRHGWTGRQLRRMFLDADLSDITVRPHAILLSLAFLRQILAGHLAKAQAAGEIAAQGLERWWLELATLDGQGRFFACVGGFIVAGTRA